jgi:FAD/FMN-containing dehydrogenase
MVDENNRSSLLSTWPDTPTLEDSIDLLPFQRDASVVKRGFAEAVMQPKTPLEVGEILRQADYDRVPVYVRGAGTMYAGGANPHAGGIVIDLSGMEQLLEIDLQKGIVVVEAGTKFGALLEALKPLGQTIGIVPLTGPTATIGGAVSSHALGTGSPRHQSMGDCVAGLEVVLVDGTVVRTGSAGCSGAGFFQRYCIGPDLTGLFIGADATLGVITAVCLWLYPLPESRKTLCLGFQDVMDASKYLSAVQSRELTRNMWYGGGYESGAINGRVSAARPDVDTDSLPKFCVGIELGGKQDEINCDHTRLIELGRNYGGKDFGLFDEIYFHKLRLEETYWYSFAGYFTRSRCALLMCSLPSDRLPQFLKCLESMREKWEQFFWGGALVVCRRGLHAGVVTFYDEKNQWEEVMPAVSDAVGQFTEAGIVPYKSGKIWSKDTPHFEKYQHLLRMIKKGVDPRGILSPGNLGV